MPTDLFYSTGQAARELAVSPATLRALCAAGAIEHQTTAGGQYRLPKSVVEKLKRDGLPAVPRPLPDEGGSRPRKNAGRDLLLGPPSNAVAESAEAAVGSGHELQIARNKLKVLKLRKEATEVGDFFEDRKRQRVEEEAAEQRRREQTEAEWRRRECVDKWLAYALDSLPYDAPAEVRPNVQEQVEATLAKSHPGQPDYTVQRIVDGAVERALAPWRRQKEKQRAITEACESYKVPWDMRRDPSWKHRLQQAAAAAIDDSASTEMQAAATAAVAPLVREYDHQQACDKIVKDCWMKLPAGWTAEGRQDGEDAARQALSELPVGATERQMEKVCDGAIAPICARITEREQQQQAERARRQDQQMRESVIQFANIRLPWGMSSEATEEALTEIREALDELPEGTARAELDSRRRPHRRTLPGRARGAGEDKPARRIRAAAGLRVHTQARKGMGPRQRCLHAGAGD